MRFARVSLWLATLAGLCACSQVEILENSPLAVSVRYDGILRSLADATATAREACATHGKIAQLRHTDTLGLSEHIAHFACVSG